MKKYIIIFSAVAAVATVSCKKMLDTKPLNSLDLNGGVLQTKEGLNATLVSVYSSLQTSGYYGRDFVASAELLADNAEITSQNTNRLVNQFNNAPGSHIGIWAAAFANIYRTNVVLDNVDKVTNATDAEKTKIKGQAHFLRALEHFDLVRVYARNPNHLVNNFDYGVPIVTKPALDPTQIEYPPRSKSSEVYSFVIAELLKAATALDNTGNAFRPRRIAAHALLSRVYLYNADWQNAEKYADSVLLSSLAAFPDSAAYFGSWGSNHPEMIWGLAYSATDNQGTDGIQYIYYRNLPVNINGYGDITASTSLRNDMGTDNRRKLLINQQVKSGQTVYYTLKWPGLKGLGQDDIMLLRTSEVLLNRAEARARQGKDALAQQDVNRIRKRAGLPDITSTGATLIQDILKERRVELAFEGHRLFDLLRLGLNVVKASTINYTDYRLIAPIPQGELDINPNLKPQNPGY
jgi:starch-binding outer membrane protein, SusD/RagB family